MPTLKRVDLRHFSLYSTVGAVSQSMRPGSVFCLAGANGLGKSTFLAAINFGFTGIVASPTRRFENFRQFYNESLEWSRNYFDGRIDEFDRDSAEIELSFSVGDTHYTLTRSLFEPTRLRALHIRDESVGRILVDLEAEEDSDELHALYVTHILRDCNLGDFSQFVFLQHFLLTFDERRHLLFWDEAASEPALYLAFGLDAQVTVQASDLRKKINKSESDARNAQWQATQALNRIKSFGIDVEQRSFDTDLVEEHKALVRSVDEATTAKDAARQTVADSRLRLAEVAASQASLKLQYSELFAKQYESGSEPSSHPLVRTALTEHVCGVCGTTGAQVAVEIQRRLDASACPLCASNIEASAGRPSELDGQLSELDQELARITAQVENYAERLERVAEEFNNAGAQLEAAEQRLTEFERNNSDLAAVRRPTSDSTVAAKVAQLQGERMDAQRRRDEHRRRKEAYKRELRPIQDQLTEAYANAETEFVPLFRDLAYRFIGIDLDVFLNVSANGLSIGLEVAGVRRRGTTELSESQRFFLDIALRMALIEHMTARRGGATLFIDTPEGSLDIAYEARAGEMFAEFVRRANQIVMTANINASQMLKSLAMECGSAHMDLLRMTDWAPLSEVQARSEDLFDDAYAAIEEALERGERLA